MRVIVLFLAIAVLLALGRGMDGPLATAGVVYTWEVDDNGLSCLTPPAGASHMTIADALAVVVRERTSSSATALTPRTTFS